MGIKGYQKKPRGVEKRKRTRFVFLSAEGKNKTETLYFRQFQNQSVHFKFVSGHDTDPVKMSKALIKKMEAEGFDATLGDYAYCLVDGDNHPYKTQQITDADLLAREHRFQIILSNPCFEVWFICHDHFTTKQYSSSDDVYDEVRSLFPKYSKSELPERDFLFQNLPTAIENAKKQEKWNEERGKKAHTVEYMPSTEVYKIFEEADIKSL